MEHETRISEQTTKRGKAIVFGLMAVAIVMFLALLGGASAQAAPGAAPTPIATGFHSTDNSRYPVTFVTSRIVTSTYYTGTAITLAQYEVLDVQYVITQPTSVNTATVLVQYSCDNKAWTNGVDVATLNAATGNGIVQIPNFCIYTRMVVTTANSNPITVAVVGVAK